jgi:hypothetical protein
MPNESTKPTILERAQRFYARIERPFSSISLIGGFVFDALTLTRVDQFWENLWVLGHLAIVTICALIINLMENSSGHDEENPAKLHFWLVNIMQFFFGGIFSTFLVFYFRSGSIATDWPFLALLAVCFIANERLKKHYARLAFQIALLFISYYAFAIYLMPILFHEISTPVFLLSGAASLVAIGLFILVLRKFSHERFVGRAKWFTRGAIVTIFIAVNVLYFYNLIPPLPLSLKDAGIYQSFVVNGPGDYTAQSENQGWFSFFDWSETIQVPPGAPLYAYTAVFSPTNFNTNIVHVWQYYDATQNGGSGAWTTQARVSLAVTGGADGGYRTFSLLPSPTAGSWRVNVETPRGQIIGQLRFNVVVTSTPAQLQTLQID